MRYQEEFFMWLQINKNQKQDTSKQYIGEIKRVSNHNKTDIDTEFEKDRCENLILQIESSSIPLRKESARAGAIRKYIQGIKHYNEFRSSSSKY